LGKFTEERRKVFEADGDVAKASEGANLGEPQAGRKTSE